MRAAVGAYRSADRMSRERVKKTLPCEHSSRQGSHPGKRNQMVEKNIAFFNNSPITVALASALFWNERRHNYLVLKCFWDQF